MTQPWAFLVVAGLKQFETRSWLTSYRGPLAIHAAKRYPRDAEQFAFSLFSRCNSGPAPEDVMRQHPLLAKGFTESVFAAHNITRGAVIGKVVLVDCVKVEEVRDKINSDELQLGDYSDGRFAWKMAEAEMFKKPIPAKGALGLWEWKS